MEVELEKKSISGCLDQLVFFTLINFCIQPSYLVLNFTMGLLQNLEVTDCEKMVAKQKMRNENVLKRFEPFFSVTQQ